MTNHWEYFCHVHFYKQNHSESILNYTSLMILCIISVCTQAYDRSHYILSEDYEWRRMCNAKMYTCIKRYFATEYVITKNDKNNLINNWETINFLLNNIIAYRIRTHTRDQIPTISISLILNYEIIVHYVFCNKVLFYICTYISWLYIKVCNYMWDIIIYTIYNHWHYI